ncbi:hypothetical protein FOZ63_013257, partial [Perkinsus olseni]
VFCNIAMLSSSLPIICLALAPTLGSTTQGGREVSHLPSFSNILVNRAIREDVLRSGVLNSSTVAYLSGLPGSALASVPPYTPFYEVLRGHQFASSERARKSQFDVRPNCSLDVAPPWLVYWPFVVLVDTTRVLSGIHEVIFREGGY